MLSLPLPFIVALLLLILLGQLLRRDDNVPINRPFAILLGVYALQSVVIGLRWSYELKALLPLQATLAAFLAALAWLCFRNLAPRDAAEWSFPAWLHGLPAAAVLALTVLWPDGIEPLLIVILLSYGSALIRLAWRGPDALSRAPFEGTAPTLGALWATAILLILSAALEAAVGLAIAWGQNAQAALLVGIAHLLALLVLGRAAAVAGRSRTAAEPAVPEAAPTVAPDGEDIAVVARLDEFMRTKRVFQELDLSLDRLARKTVLPARRISTAINRVTGKNVSQYINDHRIAEACRLLAETDEPVTEIMFQAGFQTKSNFNREFRRVTGLAPKAWRARRVQDGGRPAEPRLLS